MRRLGGFAVAMLIGVVASSCGGGGAGPGVATAEADAAADFTYVIPAGTAARIDRGEDVDLLPARLVAEVGQVIRIENQDGESHSIGPFFVGANQTLTQRFSAEGTYVGVCNIHRSGQFELVVLEV